MYFLILLHNKSSKGKHMYSLSLCQCMSVNIIYSFINNSDRLRNYIFKIINMLLPLKLIILIYFGRNFVDVRLLKRLPFKIKS